MLGKRNNMPSKINNMQKSKLYVSHGFTLLEVLVALAIFAVTALALLKIAANNTQAVMQNQLRTKAQFVAMNVAAEQQINGQWLSSAQTDQRDEQGATWHVTQTPSPTLSPHVQRVDIDIAYQDPDGGERFKVTTLTRYISRQTTS